MKFKKIYEARSHPELNPKISAYEILKKYKDDKNIYVSYRDINKIGINPQTQWNTPNGVYTYPLKEIWNDIEKSKSSSGVPWAGDKEYIYIVKQQGPGFIKDLYSDYGSINFDNDEVDIWKFFNNNFKANNDSIKKFIYNTIKSYSISKSKEKSAVSNFWYFTKNISSFVLDNKSNNGLKIYSDELISKINEIIEMVVPFKDINKIKNIVYNELERNISYDRDLTTYCENIYYNIIKSISDNSKKSEVSISNIIEKVKFVSSLIGTVNIIISSCSINNDKTAQMWNNLFRFLGYTGVADKSGRGIIHRNEPIQAVFFTIKGFKVIETILNKTYKEPNEFTFKTLFIKKQWNNLYNFIIDNNINVNEYNDKFQLNDVIFNLFFNFSENQLKTLIDKPLMNDVITSGLIIKKIINKLYSSDDLDFSEFLKKLKLFELGLFSNNIEISKKYKERLTDHEQDKLEDYLYKYGVELRFVKYDL